MINILAYNEEIDEIGNHLETTNEFISDSSFSEYIEYNITDSPVKDNLYYFFIHMRCNPSFFVQTTSFFNSHKVVDLYKSGYNIKFVMTNFVECGLSNELDIISEKIQEVGIKNSDLIVVTENLQIDNFNNTGITAKSIAATPVNISAAMISSLYPNDMEFIEDKKYLFQCFNNTNKPHRYAILSLLKYYDLLKYVDYSLLRPENFFPPSEYHDSFIRHIFSLELSKKLYDSYCYILNGGKSKYIETEDSYIRDPNANLEPSNTIFYKENPYKHAYINIVTESQYEASNLTHITEKTPQPFYFLQIPIFVATPHFVKHVREYFDFDLFDDLIDHSYDDEFDSEKRMILILEQIKKLANNKEYVKEFYVSNKHRLLENQRKVAELKNTNTNIQDTFKNIFL